MTEMTDSDLIEASITRVWNERDDERRLAAIGEIYGLDATMYEPARPVSGHEAMSQLVAGVLADMPPGFRFVVTGPALGHHGMFVARWQGRIPTGEVIVSGSDAARVEDARIQEHWFFFDPKE
jgi:hypothetical protein